MAKTSSKNKSKEEAGFTPKTFKGGYNPARFNRGGGGAGGDFSWKKRLKMKKGQTIPVQFLGLPGERPNFEEGECHVFREQGMWKFVPCADDGCPLCDSDDPEQARTSYRFWCNVYNHEAKKVEILEGGGNLAQVIHNRFGRGAAKFTRRVFDLTMFPTKPVSFQLERAEDEEALSDKKLSSLEGHDLVQYMADTMKEYYGESLDDTGSKKGRTSLDDDDDDDDDDEEHTVEDLMEMTSKEVRSIAKEYKIKLVDSDGDKRSQNALAKLIVKKQQ